MDTLLTNLPSYTKKTKPQTYWGLYDSKNYNSLIKEEFYNTDVEFVVEKILKIIHEVCILNNSASPVRKVTVLQEEEIGQEGFISVVFRTLLITEVFFQIRIDTGFHLFSRYPMRRENYVHCQCDDSFVDVLLLYFFQQRNINHVF